MKDFFNKNIIWLVVMAWLIMAGTTIIQLSKILSYNCFFLNSWPFCVAPLSVSNRMIQGLILALVVFIFSVLSYWLYKNLFLKKEEDKKVYWWVIILVCLLVVLILPFSSSDFQYYFSLGQSVNNGVNPYLGDFTIYHPYFYNGASAYGTAQGTMYGPIIVSLFTFLYQLSGGSLLLFTLFWKLLMAAILILMGLVLKSLFNNQSNKFWWVFWLLQPLILWELVGNGHFDGLWLIFVLWAIILVKRGWWWAVVVVLTISIWLKVVPVLLLPWFVLWWWQGLNKDNWLKQTGLILASLIISLGVSILAWFPYWHGWVVFQPVILQSKWVVNSLFGFVYYGLQPLAQSAIGGSYHWWLTRFVHLILLGFCLYLFWPYFKKILEVILKRVIWQPVDYYQAIFVSLLIYISVWQKSFWPWYMIWLLPFGLLILDNVKDFNWHVFKIIRWLSWSPLLFYVVMLPAGGELWSIWFFLFNFLVVMFYPLYQIYLWRKERYVGN